jgi:hypothetical protein
MTNLVHFSSDNASTRATPKFWFETLEPTETFTYTFHTPKFYTTPSSKVSSIEKLMINQTIFFFIYEVQPSKHDSLSSLQFSYSFFKKYKMTHIGTNTTEPIIKLFYKKTLLSPNHFLFLHFQTIETINIFTKKKTASKVPTVSSLHFMCLTSSDFIHFF